ncbi:MAG: hypothetical protein ABIG44_18175 [Planctomycetota bacterium]
MAGEPYCSNCGRTLTGLAASDTCPGCGARVADVHTTDPTAHGIGRRWQSKTKIFGWPLVHIAQGPHGEEKIGKARGVIAIGDVAVGGVAIGGMSFGVVAIGGLSVGLVSIAGLAIGLLALGGLAIGGAAVGGGAVGGIVAGGGAIGYVAMGGGAVGYYVQAGGGFGVHVMDGSGRDAEAVRFFSQWQWLLGSPTGQMYRFLLWILAGSLVITACMTLIVLLAYIVRPREYEYR